MTTTMWIITAAILTTGAVAVIVVALWQMFSEDKSVGSRMTMYLGNSDYTFDGQEAPIGDQQFTERINQAINNQSFAETLARQLAQANLPLTVPEYMLIRLAVPLLMALLALLIWRDMLFLPIALGVGAIAPTFWLRGRIKKRNQNFDEQLAETITTIASSLRGGFSLPQGINNTGKESPEPTRSELRRVTQEIQLGLSIGQALDNLKVRVESDDLDLVVTAIKIHARVGGNLTHILDTMATTIRERSKLRREIRVITSMQRISSYVIGLLPVALALILFAINPSYMKQLFLPGWTLCIPIGAAISSAIGFFVIQRIIDIKI